MRPSSAATTSAELERQRDGVERALRAEHEARHERAEVQERRGVAQHAVRGHHERVERRVAARREQPALEDDRPGVAHHPPLARELALDRGHHLLGRARLRHVHRAPAALDHVEGKREVVAHDRVDLDVGLAPRGVDRAVAAGHRVQPRLQRAQRHLVAPVQPLLVRPAVVDEPHLAAGVADLRVGERGDEHAQRVGLPRAVGVREGDDLRARAGDRLVLGADLAAALELEHVVGAGAAGLEHGPVGRAVAGDDDPQPLARVVERQRVRDLARDDGALVVGGDDQADRRRIAARRRGGASRGAGGRARRAAAGSRACA